MSWRQQKKLTRQDYFKRELDRCGHVLQKLNVTRYGEALPRRHGHERLRSQTMSSFEAYVNKSDLGKAALISSPSLTSFRHGDPGAWSLNSAANVLGMAAAWRSTSSDAVMSKPMNADELCDFLSRRGLGDPRDLMNRRKDRRRQEYDDRRQVAQGARRRQRDQRHVTYYLEKLRAQSFLDSAAANSRAEAFCEQQGVRPLRTVSATYRTPGEPVEVNGVLSDSGSEASGSDSDVSNLQTEGRCRQELFARIASWLQDCERAGAVEEDEKQTTNAAEKGGKEKGGKGQLQNPTTMPENGIRSAMNMKTRDAANTKRKVVRLFPDV